MKSSTLLAFAVTTALAATVAHARITKIEIDCTISQAPSVCPGQAPTFEGRTFGSVGAYEKLRGKAYGALSPADRRNAIITDIELAKRNPATGLVDYSMDIYILKPVDLSRGNHKVYMEVNNRGGKLFGSFNGSSGGNNPTTAAHAGDAFLMNLGYSLVWNGWDPGAPPGADRLTINVGPALKNADGSDITGPSYEYIVFDNATTTSSALAYPAASLDKSKATLTVRDHLMQPPTTIPETGWSYNATGTAINLNGAPFKQSAIYEFSYTAKDPVVLGIGFAATRDFISFLKHAEADDFSNANPLRGNAQQVLAFTVSQPARFLNEYETLGFNEDEQGRRAIDGILNWIGGGNGVNMNFRFGQTGRTERNRQNHRYPEAPFPFAYPELTDPYTGKTAGRSVRCSATNTCPKAMQANSSNEYWVKTSSLLHSYPDGSDLPRDPENVRFYLFSGVEHTGAGSPPNSPGSCQQNRNTTNPNPVLRALFVALDEWVTKGATPPKSQVPGPGTRVYSVPVGNGVGIVPQDELGWPSIPGVAYSGLITVRHLFNFGARFDDGIMDINPPNFSGPVYPSYVSRVDADGNEIAGIRLPAVAAPIATTTGWALRSAAFGGGPAGGNMDGRESSGQEIAFKATKAERLASGDPRKSLEERYKDHAGYVKAVAKEARKLEERRLLLPADVQRYIDAAQASSVLR
jgi:hypothetical protein